MNYRVKRPYIGRFKPNRRFRREYRRIFDKNPVAANLFLLLAELADEYGGEVKCTESELAHAMRVRFDDPREYAL